MRKVYLSLLVFMFSTTLVFSQNLTDTIYMETFEVTPYQVTTYGNPLWFVDSTINTTLSTNTHYMRGTMDRLIHPGDSTFLETDYFRTKDSFYVLLRFTHIGKLSPFNAGLIELTVDSGKTWTQIRASNAKYQGDALAFQNPPPAGIPSDTFNSLSYIRTATPPIDWEASLQAADSTMWVQELFNISNLAEDQAAVKIRFKNVETSLGFATNHTGWLVDDIIIEKAFDEIEPPIIDHISPLTGKQFPADSFLVEVDIDDFSGTHQAWVIFNVNGGAFDSIPMSRMTKNRIDPCYIRERWEAYLTQPSFEDGDTICYYVSAQDSSKLFNYAAVPDTFQYCFLASGKPDLTLISKVEGKRLAGNYSIIANARDGSGIDNVTLYYSVNGGAYQPLLMANTPPGSSNYAITLGTGVGVFDGDTVCYYVEATDASTRNNTCRLPELGDPAYPAGCYEYINGGPPVVWLPTMSSLTVDSVLLGNIYKLGPFDVFAYAQDGSGINRVECIYTINSGALQKINMTKIVGTPYTYTAQIPAVNDSDEVCYYFVAVDQSPRMNTDTITQNFRGQDLCFLALDGIKFPFMDDFEGSDLFIPDAIFAGWERGTPSQTKINGAFSGTIAWMTDLDGDYLGNRTMYLVSPPFKFDTSATNVVMSFLQHREIDPGTLPAGLPINDGDGFYIEYTTDVNSTQPNYFRLGGFNDPNALLNWYNQQQVTAPVAGPAWNGRTGTWIRSDYVLSNLNNIGRVRFRFVFKSNGGGNDEGVAIDNFSLAVAPDYDLELRTMLYPTEELRGGTKSPISFSVANRGAKPVDSIPVSYTINGGALVNGNLPISLQPGDSIVIPQGFLPDFVVPDYYYDLCAYTRYPNDGNADNDTLCIKLYGTPTVSLPYIDTFENTPENFIARGAPPNRINDWQRGVPAGNRLNSALSAPNAWGTILDDNYSFGARSWLYSPYFNFDTSVNMTYSMWQNRLLKPDAILRVEYTQDFGFTWIPLVVRLNDPNGENWFNGQASIPGVGSNLLGFVGNTNGWEENRYLLSLFDYRPDPIRFRLAMETSYNPKTDEGVLIDDFAIEDPCPVNAGVIAIKRPTPVPALPAMVEVEVFVKNFGRDTLKGVQLNYSHAGVQQIAGNYLAPDTIPPGKVALIKMPTYPSVIIGFYEFCAYTVEPNDCNLGNDSTCIIVEGLPPNEVVMTEVFNPRDDTCYSVSDQEVCFEFRNIGHSTLTQITVSYVHDAIMPVTQVYPGLNVMRDSSQRLCFNQKLALPEGKTDIKIYADHPLNDRNFLDDTFRLRVNAIPIYSVVYENDFEIGLKSLDDFCLVESERNGRIRARIRTGHELTWTSQLPGYSMQMGAQTNNPTWTNATSTNIWTANRNPSYLGRAKLKLAVEANPNIHVTFWKNYFVENNTQAFFRITVDGQDAFPFGGGDPPCTYRPQAASTGFPTPWECDSLRPVDVDLQGLYSVGDTIDLEFQAKCQLPNAVNIDSITIFNQVDLSAAVKQVVTDPPLMIPNQTVTGKILIRNSGKQPISFVTATLQVDGNVVGTQNFSFNPPLEFLDESLETFSNTFTIQEGGHEICMWTSNPNGLTDLFTLDDTLCRNDDIRSINTFPYCTDFENGREGWRTYNSENYIEYGLSWELGDPEPADEVNTFGLLDTAYSGANCWATGLNYYYETDDSSGLYTPIFNIASDTCYTLSFQHRFDIDSTGDGGTVEYTYDGGRNWYPIGSLGAKDWYNAHNIKALLQREPLRLFNGTGWTGSSQGNWVLASRDFKLSNAPVPVVFRFRFGSDESNQGDRDHEGWALDDFCFEVKNGGCLPLGEIPITEDLFAVDPSYPNPTATKTLINYYIPKGGEVKLELRDAIGKLLMTQNMGRLAAGQQQYELDLSKYSQGMYFYTMEFNNQRITQRVNVIR